MCDLWIIRFRTRATQRSLNSQSISSRYCRSLVPAARPSGYSKRLPSTFRTRRNTQTGAVSSGSGRDKDGGSASSGVNPRKAVSNPELVPFSAVTDLLSIDGEREDPPPLCLTSDWLDTPEGCTPMKLIVFSGGTAFNSVASSFRSLTTAVTHVLPVSDDGGSTAEIVRVLGGPAVGDIRSRCLRVSDASDPESQAVKQLLAHRLSKSDSADAKREWMEIVEGEHALWDNVSDPYKHTIRAFLVHFHSQILSHATLRFNFTNGSVGNFFFAGARLFFRSLDAAIFLFSRVARIPEGTHVMPVICTEERITLGAELEDGSIIRGQNEISHPSSEVPELQMHVDKDAMNPLQSRVKRIFYLSSEGDHQEHEVFPLPNPQVVSHLDSADVIVYGMGSLYTSICPTLILRGVGEAIAASDAPKIMVLNGHHDRETSACVSDARGMSASDIVQAVCTALNRTFTHPNRGARLQNSPKHYITALLIPKTPGTDAIDVDTKQLRAMGVSIIHEVETVLNERGHAMYVPEALVQGVEDVVVAHASRVKS